MSAQILSTLRDVAGALERAGVPPVSPFWLATAERFYTHPSAHVLVACVGRGGDKSRMSVLMAIAEVLGGEHAVPTGERHHFAHVSENRGEAGKTLDVLERYLHLLGLQCDRVGETIDLAGRPLGFKVLACRVGAVSGFRCMGWSADECAKWSDDGANPSAEIIASIKAMTVTHPNARGRILSSPLGAVGYFYDRWAAGDSAEQLVTRAPTWVANPSVTEEHTHRLEANPRVWRREYLAVPQDDALGAFEAPFVDEAHVPLDFEVERVSEPIYVIDASDVSNECEFTGAEAVWVRRRLDPDDYYLWKTPLDPNEGHGPDRFMQPVRGARSAMRDPKTGGLLVNPEALAPRPPLLYVHRVWGVRARDVSIDQVHDHIAEECHSRGVAVCTGDQFNAAGNLGGLGRRGVRFIKRGWNATNKQTAVGLLRRLMFDARLVLDPHCGADDWRELRRQILSLQERFSGGAAHYKPKSGVLADRASLLIVAALASLPSGDEPSLFGIGDPMGRPPPARHALPDEPVFANNLVRSSGHAD